MSKAESKPYFSPRALLTGVWQRRRNLSIISLSSYTTLALTSLLQVVIARLLGAESFGTYAAHLALIALIEVPLITRGSELSLRQLGEAWNAGDPDSLRSLTRQIIHHDSMLYGAALVVILLLAWFFRHWLSLDFRLLSILALVIPAQVGFGVFKSYFIIFDKVREMVRYEFVYVIFQICVSLAGLVLWGLYGLAAATVVAAIGKTVLAHAYTRTFLPASGPRSHSQGTPVLVSSLTRQSAYPLLRSLFSNGLLHVDVVLLSMLQRPEVVALYRVGKSLASLPIKISFPVWRYLQPKLLEAMQKGETRKQMNVILSGSVALAAAMLILLAPVLLLGETVLVFLYGEEYRGAFQYFLILLVGVWTFHAIAGWFKFWAVVAQAQLYGIAVFAAAFVATIAFGAIFARNSPIAMAYVVSAVHVVASIVVFARVLRPCAPK